MVNKKVVVTGLGIISPIGNDVESFWHNLVNGKSGISKITAFDASDYAVDIAGEIKDFDPTNYMPKKDANRMDRFAQFAVAASKMALEHSGLDLTKLDPYRVGIYVGSGIGGLGTLEAQHTKLLERGPRKVSPFFIPMMISNMASGQVSIHTGIKGPNFSIVSACTTGTHSIGEALRLIQRGEVDVMLAGGAESTILPMAVAGFASMGALSSNFNDGPTRASRPFEKNRDGFVMSEGAGVLVLESLDHALKRDAKIICELSGYGLSSDAYHLTSPSPEGEGAVRSMLQAANESTSNLTEVDYINAHGTATYYNDKIETAAIKSLFGDHAYKLAVSSNKSMVGHLLGASGGLEAIATALTLQDQIIPPTINYDTVDPECDLDYVPNEARKAAIRIALSNSFGFGGHNATIAMKAYS